ncbi:MAG: type II secretion system protein N, partial [Halofilum sp. (in: g-proteobacteria)]|nr:type II secretion system protein N [Halofilum sp. (in: g-proteobacteria)]
AEGGELAIDGNARLQADGRWQLDLKLVPSAEAGERLHELLTLRGAREDGQGNYRLRRSGSL